MAALRQALWYWKRIVTKDPKYQGHHQRQEMAAANAGAVGIRSLIRVRVAAMDVADR
jgi:hypothetical protein